MVRRPLIYAASAAVLAIIVCYYFSAWIALIPVVIFFMRMPRFEKEKKGIWIVVFFYIFSIVNFQLNYLEDHSIPQHSGKVVQLLGRVATVERKCNSRGERYLQMKVDVKSVNSETSETKERILVNYYPSGNNDEFLNNNEAITPTDIIDVKGEFKIPACRRNPGCFDYGLYLKSSGINAILDSSKITVKHNRVNNSLFFYIHKNLYLKKELFLQNIANASSKETAAFIRAVLFGEKNELDEGLLEEFQKNGTAHILAVSGLHVGIIYGFISKLWRWKKKSFFFFVITVFFTCYMFLASFSPSVVRAVFMIELHIFAQITQRRYDLSSAAFFVLICIITKNPMTLFNTGLQMSFIAILTLSLILPIIKKIYSGVFLGSLAVQLGLLPYTIYTFNYFSIAAVFVNVPIIMLSGILVPTGLCAMCFMILNESLFNLLAGVLYGFCEILSDINSVTAIDGITVFQVISPPLGLVCIYYLSLLVFLSEEGRRMFLRRKKNLIMLCIACVLIISGTFSKAIESPLKNADLVFVDVGQGDCMHLKVDNKNYLIDGGGNINYNIGKKTLKPYLLKNGVRKVDGAFVTHLHTDHYKGIVELCREGMVDKLFLYDGNKVREREILEETGLAKEDIVYLYKNQQLSLGDYASAHILWPERKTDSEYIDMADRETDENLSSLIIKFMIKGRSFIATGDLDEEYQNNLYEIWGNKLNSDILKVAHHGSKYSYSESFMQAVSPDFTVFQVGKNNFGHPDKRVVEKCYGISIMVYRNDEDGAIGFEFLKENLVEITTEIEKGN